MDEAEEGRDAGVPLVGRERATSRLELLVPPGELDCGDNERREGPADSVAAFGEFALCGLQEL